MGVVLLAALVSSGAILSLIIVAYVTGYGMRPKDFPPGPPTLPIVGNLHQLPMSNLHIKLQEWSRKYGPIMSLKLGTQDMIVVSSDRVARDLLDKKGGMYSGRMDVFIREFGEDLNILLQDNDEVWRRLRKMYHLRLNVNVADKYIPYQEFETSQLLFDILQSPERFQEHARRYTTSLGSTMIYGWRTTSVKLPHVKKLFEWIDGYSIAAGRLQVMDWFPWLRPIFRNAPSWITGISQEMKRLKDIEDNLWLSLLKEAKTSISRGSAKSSFCIDMILNNDIKSGDFLTEKQLAANAGHGWAGASDTTLNSTLAFIKAMMLFPDAQRQAQEELDTVIGSSRLPTWADSDKLPYMRSLVKETLRWFPSSLLGGMPHRLSKEDFYDSYRLPANAGVLLNVWTINNDPRRAENPRKFDPSRFKGDLASSSDSAAAVEPSKRDHYTFGAGRRICPGIHVAERSLFITLSRLLWAFKFSRPVGSDGNIIPIDPDAVTAGFIVAPPRFQCIIEPRDAQRATLIKENWRNCQKDLDEQSNYTEQFYERVFQNTNTVKG